jgi:hypothetical protein
MLTHKIGKLAMTLALVLKIEPLVENEVKLSYSRKDSDYVFVASECVRTYTDERYMTVGVNETGDIRFLDLSNSVNCGHVTGSFVCIDLHRNKLVVSQFSKMKIRIGEF